MESLMVNGLYKTLGHNLEYQRFTWINKTRQDKCIKIVNMKTGIEIYENNILADVNTLDLKLKLDPRTSYQCVFSEQRTGAEIKKVKIETGKSDEEWTSRWITTEMNNPIFTRTFNVEKIVNPRLYICCLGIYNVLINDHPITKEVLLPGYYSYDLWLQSNTFDLESVLKVGENKIEIQVTDGWYKGRLGFSGGSKNQYGENLMLIAELYENEETLSLITDTDWSCNASNITSSSIYDGEIQDYTIRDKGVSTVSVVAKDMPIMDRMNNRIIKAEKILPTITEIEKDVYLLDLNQNITGWLEFDSKLKKGEVLRYQVGEVLQDGKFYRENLRTAKAEFEYVSDGINRHVQPVGTFFGFRYALVETSANILALNIHARVIHSELERTGEFETSDTKINRLYQNIIWGQKGNFLDIPTDCPQRDERLGWTGDAQVFFDTAALNYNVENFFRNYLHNLKLEQQQHNGVVPLFIPSLRKNVQSLGGGMAGWSDAGTIISWKLYETYQNIFLLEEHYPIMKDWANHLINYNKISGNEFLWESEFQLGDWLALDGKSKDAPIGGTDTTFIASIYFYVSVLYAANAAKVLSKKESQFFSEYAQKIKDEIRREFITANGRLVVNTQTAYALIVEYDLFDTNQLDTIKQGFINRLYEDRFMLKTGFIGTPIILSSLTKLGLNQIAVKMFENQNYPGWINTVNLGATTIWERWNSILADGTINSEGMNSLNHYAYGSVGKWMYSNLLGIRVDEIKKLIIISPNLYSSLKTMDGKIRTLNGDLLIKICKNVQEILIEIYVPYGYEVQNKINDQQLFEGHNQIKVPIYSSKTSDMTILEVCSDYQYRAVIEKHMPIIFEDQSIINCKFKKLVDVQQYVSKKRLISDSQLNLVLNEISSLKSKK